MDYFAINECVADDGDIENDGELLAELLTLENEKKRVNEATSKVFAKNESLEKIVVKDISTQDLDVNVSFDADNIILGDEDLLAELDVIVGNAISNDEKNSELTMQSSMNVGAFVKKIGDLSECLSELPSLCDALTTSGCALSQFATTSLSQVTTTVNKPPAVATRALAMVGVASDGFDLHGGTTTHVNTVSIAEKPTSDAYVSVSQRAEQILKSRRAEYMKNAKAAKEANDKLSATEFLSVVKLFNQALEAIKNGTELSEEDITMIPASPAPYKKSPKPINLIDELTAREAKYREIAAKFGKVGDESRERLNERMANQHCDALKRIERHLPVDVAALPVPPGFAELLPELIGCSLSGKESSVSRTANVLPSSGSGRDGKHDISRNAAERPSTAISATNTSYLIPENIELKLVLMRQLQLKRAAVRAKASGDVAAAVELLNKAKTLDQMVEAAHCGLPLNVKVIPIPPLEHFLPHASFSISTASNRLTATLHRELVKQARMLNDFRSQFQALGDTQAVLKYETLFLKCHADLDRLEGWNQDPPPKFQIVQKQLVVVDHNVELASDALELQILRVVKLKLPDGWRPSDCALYATYKFQFPHDAHQTGRTQTIRGTGEPTFPDVFLLNINRASRQLLRIIRRMPLKIEIYQKGGFLRSDRLLGLADISIAKLEESSTLMEMSELLDGRRKTGGHVCVQIKISKPIGENGASTTKTIVRKWVELCDVQK